MSKLERLLNLTALLLETSRPLRVDEIGEKMAGDYPPDGASFRRAFERDKDELRDAGIPIEVVPLDPADATKLGYRIDPGRYYLGELDLAPEELAVLRLALAELHLDDEVDVETFRKLGGVPTEELETAPVAELSVTAEVEVLYAAIEERRAVEFRYGGAERRLEPHRLDHRAGRWYVTGRDLDREARRSFRLDRVEGDLRVGPAGTFTAPAEVPGVRFEPWRFGDGPAIEAVVAVDADHVFVARSRLGPSTRWEEAADGSARAHLRVTDVDAFRHVVLSLLDHVTVEEPPELRADLVAWLEALA